MKDTDPRVLVRYSSRPSVPQGNGSSKVPSMRPTRLLISVAILPLACVQAPQTAPPPVTAATAAPVMTAAPVAPSPEASPAGTVVAAAPRRDTVSKPPSTAAGTASTPSAVRSAPSTASADKTSQAVVVPARVRLIVPAGTLLPIEIQTSLSSATSRQGDPVIAVLTADVPLDGFKLDKGSEVRGQVRTVIPAKRVKGRAQLVVDFDAVMEEGEKLSIMTEPLDSMAASTSGKDKKIIAGGAVGGLIIGAIKDGKKGAAVGTVVGAAAGTGAVLVMKGDEVEIPRGAQLTLTVIK